MKKILYSLLLAVLCVGAGKAQSFDRSIRPAAAPAKEVNIKDAQTFTLANGLKVFLVEDQTTPLVYYALQLDVKPALEGDKVGLKDLFTEVFGKATKNRNKEELNKAIDLISMRGGVHRSGGYAYVLKKYDEQALDILTDMLFNPLFLQEEFDLGLNKFKTSLSSIGDDAGQINSRLASALIYGKGYPAGELETVETLENISLTDLEAYYQTYFAPNVARLVIVGDLSKKEAQKQAEKYFGQWKKKEVPEAKYTLPTAPAERKVAFAQKAGAVQSAIDICYPITYNLKEKDYDAAYIMNQILGGSGTAHLFMNLREDKGWTYGVYSSLAAGEQIGSFSLGGRRTTSVKAAVTDSAVFEILKELNRMIDEPVDEEELKNAVTFSAGTFSRALANSETMAQFAVNIDKYNLPKDYYRNYLKRLEALTPADIQAAAKKYIRPENAWVVVTSDKQYAEGLAPFAADGKVQWHDLNANPIEAPQTQAADIAPEEVIARYVEAIGGKAAIEGVNDYTLVGEMSVMGQTGKMESSFKKPNLSSTTMSLQGMVLQKMNFDGQTLRMSGMQGSREITEGQDYDAVKNNYGLCTEMNYLANGYQLTVEGIETINGEPAYILKLEKDGRTTRDYYSVSSGLKLRSVEILQTPMGEMPNQTDYEEYRAVEGVRFPFVVKQSAMGQTLSTTITSVVLNKGVDSAIFK